MHMQHATCGVWACGVWRVGGAAGHISRHSGLDLDARTLGTRLSGLWRVSGLCSLLTRYCEYSTLIVSVSLSVVSDRSVRGVPATPACQLHGALRLASSWILLCAAVPCPLSDCECTHVSRRGR